MFKMQTINPSDSLTLYVAWKHSYMGLAVFHCFYTNLKNWSISIATTRRSVIANLYYSSQKSALEVSIAIQPLVMLHI